MNTFMRPYLLEPNNIKDVQNGSVLGLEDIISRNKDTSLGLVSQQVVPRSNFSYLTFETDGGLYCTDVSVDMTDEFSAYKSALSELGSYFQQFLDIKGKHLLPTIYEGTKDLGKNVLGQAEIRSTGYRPLDSRVSLSDNMFAQVKEYDELSRLKGEGYEVIADGAFLGVLYHELIHSTGELDEVKTRLLTKEFFEWFRDTYTKAGSIAYDKATIAAEIGGAPLSNEEIVKYPRSMSSYEKLDYAA